MKTAAPSTGAPVLQMRGISKTFFGVRALNDVQLDIYPGELHALMGENGAGKSTLMKVLAGAYIADPGGEIRINGQPVQIDGPLAARAHGIAIIYQELALSPNLSVAENIYLGREPRTRAGLLDRPAMYAGCAEVLRRLGTYFNAHTPVASLSIAERQQVEIARAVHAHSRILVMDEPTTTLSSRETARLFELIRQLKAEGLAIIYISHRMAEVYKLAERVTVLRDGQWVGALTSEEIQPSLIVSMMIGRDLTSFYKKQHQGGASGKVMLEVEGLSDHGRVKDCSLTLHAGEVLGLAGLVGAGRTELARLIYGADPSVAGRVRLDGQEVNWHEPRAAIEAGLVYLTEDRKAQGLFLDMTVKDNVNLAVLARDALAGFWLNRKWALVRARESIASLDIPVKGPEVQVGTLSGGNQQKVLLARLLHTRPKVLLLDEPTRGIDVGAKSEIYRIIDELACAGVAVLVISSELPELVGICDRVIVMCEGHLTGQVCSQPENPITEEAIMTLATGVELDQETA